MKPLLLCALLASPALAQETTLTLDLRFDEAATTALQQRGEMVVISAFYVGEPAPGNLLPVDEMGMVYLGSEDYTVYPLNQTVQIGHSLGAAPIGNVLAPMVNVNVYSARHTDENNLLDCGIVDGPTDALSKQPQLISCNLIGD